MNLTAEELISRIKKHSRSIKIPKNKIFISKKQKQKNDRRSWKRDLSKSTTLLVNTY